MVDWCWLELLGQAEPPLHTNHPPEDYQLVQTNQGNEEKGGYYKDHIGRRGLFYAKDVFGQWAVILWNSFRLTT